MAQDTVILKPGQQRTEVVSGLFFTVISATAKFTVQLDGRIRRVVRAGSRINGESFKRISFIETEGITNTIVYDAGDAETLGQSQVSGLSGKTFDYPYLMDISGAELTVSSVAVTNLPVVVPWTGGVSYTRKSFHIFNSGSNNIGVYASAGYLMDILRPNTERTFYFTDDAFVKAIGGNSAMALYYTLYSSLPEQ